MWNTTDKTIPFRPTESDLENLRLLRKKTNPSEVFKDDVVMEDDPWQTPPSQATLTVIQSGTVSQDK